MPESVQPLVQLLTQVWAYIASNPLVVFFEMFVIWVLLYIIFRFLRGTRGARAIKGFAVVLIGGTLIVMILGQGQQFERLDFLFQNFVAFMAIMILIVFQPELRRAFVRLGEAGFIKQRGLRRSRLVDEILDAIEYLSKNKIGALIAIEQQDGLRFLTETGKNLDAVITKELLQTIFWPNSALHDLGVVIQGDRIASAGVQFPLADGDGIKQELGSRHRAALGLAQESDAVILVVSEETGIISVAQRNHLERQFTIDTLRPLVNKAMNNAVKLADAKASNPNSTDATAVPARERTAK